MTTLGDIQSIDDRLFNLLKDKAIFSWADARSVIPKDQVSDITIYKAINRLENQRRIRYIKTTNRKKYYSTIGTSNLPVFRGPLGDDLTLKQLLELLMQPNFYIDKHWRGSNALRELPIELCRLFLVAQKDSSGVRDGWVEAVQALQNMKIELTTMLEYVETVLSHPTMSGDLDKFKQIFGGDDPDMPTPEKLNEFKRWLRTYNEQ